MRKLFAVCCIVLIAAAAVLIAIRPSAAPPQPSDQQLLQTLQDDLGIEPWSIIEIVRKDRKRDKHRDEWFIWAIATKGSEYALVGASRPTDGTQRWEMPLVLISWLDEQVGPEPYWQTYDSRPTESQIDDHIRYSYTWWQNGES